MLKCIFSLACACLSLLVFGQTSENPPAKADLSKEAFIFEDVGMKAAFETDGTGTQETSIRARLGSDAGVQQFRVLTLSYQEAVEAIEIPYIRVRKPDGSVVTTPPDNIQDMPAQITRDAPFYSDVREKQITVRGLGVGDVLEYQYLLRIQRPLAPGQFWFDYNFFHDGIVLHEHVEVSVPSDRPVKFKSAGVQPTIVEAGHRRVYTWLTSNLEIKPKQDDRQRADQIARGRSPLSDIRLTSFKSWEELGRWYGELQQERVKPTPEIRAKALEITKGATDDRARLQALYDYVSLQFHYIGVAFGIGRYQPHFAADVLGNQYGDCKDKHTLLAALAAAEGIKVYPALINSAHQIDPDIPSPSQFDHVISAVPEGKDFLWLDTTSEVAPFGLLLEPLRDKTAVIVPDDKPPVLATTLADPPFKTTLEFNIKGRLSDKGIFDGSVERSDRGDVEYVLRAAFRKLSQSQWKEMVQNISYFSGFSGTVDNVTAASPEATTGPFHFGYTYHRDFSDDWQDRHIPVPLPPIGMPILKDDEAKPASPIWLSSPREIHLHAELQLPLTSFPELPPAVDIINDLASYHARYKFQSGTLTADIVFETKVSEVPPSEFGIYNDLKKGIDNDRNRYIPLTTSSITATHKSEEVIADAVASLPDSEVPEATNAFHEAQEDVRQGDMFAVRDALKKAVVADPKFTKAWIMRGSITRMMLRDHSDLDNTSDESLDDFRRAIASDPKQPVSYKVLGFALMNNHRYDDAVSVWRNLAAIVPEDADAQANLGSALFSLHRYDEAASAFQSALDKGSQTPSLFTRLAVSSLRAGKKEQGLAAFKKASDLDPGPDTQNTMAYELAEANMDLPQALQYAQQAVHTLEEASSKVTLSGLKLEDVRRGLTLSAYWDTLGWVYYRMENYAKAEPYLKAAWNLSQDPLEGDHLGQLYEQQHRKAEAIRVYQLALAGSHPPPETASRLSHLGAPPKSTNLSVTRPAEDLSRMRSTILSRVVPGTANADFFLLVGPGAKVEDVQFVRGSQQLRSAGKLLRTIHFNLSFPPDTRARIVFKGVLACYKVTGCSFVTYPFSSISSVD